MAKWDGAKWDWAKWDWAKWDWAKRRVAAQLLIEFKALVQLRTADGNTALQVGAPGPGADVGGASPVPAQMWAGRAQSRCRRGGGGRSRR